VSKFPVAWTRVRLRALLDTAPRDLLPDIPTNAPRFRAAAEPILDDFVQDLRTHEKVELLLGFPAAPFIIPLATKDKERFLQYARRHPSHSVRLRRTGEGEHAERIASPVAYPGSYELTFTLPPSWSTTSITTACALASSRTNRISSADPDRPDSSRRAAPAGRLVGRSSAAAFRSMCHSPGSP